MTASLLLLAAAASMPLNQPATRAEVATQRAALEQRFLQDKAECEQRFNISACTEELRQRRHDALAPLVQREHELATEERLARAAAQRERVRERELAASQDEGQRREKVLTAAPPLPPSAAASHPGKVRSPQDAERTRRQAEQKADSEAARRRAQAQEREKRQQQHAAEHEAKLKARTKPAAAPLPLPAASDAK